MNQEVKEKWVAALRSDKYEQTKGYLHEDVGYCCLGVLCDIVDPAAWIDREDNVKEWIYKNEIDYLTLPSTLCNDLDITPDNAGILAEMNDNNETFSKIADYIEVNV